MMHEKALVAEIRASFQQVGLTFNSLKQFFDMAEAGEVD